MKLPIPSLSQAILAQSLCTSCAHQAKTHTRLFRISPQNSRRKYHASAPHRDNDNTTNYTFEQQQAQPLGGFYEDLLATSVPQAAPTRQSDYESPTPNPPKARCRTEDLLRRRTQVPGRHLLRHARFDVADRQRRCRPAAPG